eukprot:TRINITY_DN1351_c1_g1_i1.p1 TRINITY_DN1351_c1_g1~~TRINITY_DN1351_c1_g1_i1.p1  ORF type:complete len:258 (+),score=93.52 TRINITY_DN1351_c1_g1_i1:67-840(+)
MSVSVQRASPPRQTTNLFERGNTKEWVSSETSCRKTWNKTLKTVESAKDKKEGLAARAKGRRGGDAANRNRSSINDSTPADQSVLRRDFKYRPETRNPIMAGHMKPEEYRPGVKQINPPSEKPQPKTHKIVNLNQRTGVLQGDGHDGAFAVLAGAGEVTKESARGRRVYGEMRSQETLPPPQKPHGKANRTLSHQPTDPFKYEKEVVPFEAVDYKKVYHQRYGSTPTTARKMHSFHVPSKQPNCPGYVITPPYSVGC